MREQRLAVARTARVYVRGTTSVPLQRWVACHGYGQLARGFAEPFRAIEAPDRLVLVPEALNRFYLDPPDRPAAERRVGATWMTREDRQADIEDCVAYLDAVCAEYGRSAAQTVALGFSQGAATVCRWVVHGRTRVSHLVLWGAGFPHDLDWTVAKRRLRDVPMLLVVGDADPHMGWLAVERQCALAEEYGLSLEVRRFEGGHHLSREVLAEVSQWVQP